MVSLASVVTPALMLASFAVPERYRYYAQVATIGLFVFLYAALGVQYFRELQAIRRTRARQDAVFQSFVDAHLPARDKRP
jgi:hypothetical protein